MAGDDLYDGRVALDYISIGVAAALLGARAAYRHFFSPYARMERELKDVPVDGIGPGLSGLVHIQGQVRARGRTLVAPLSQRVCVAYELELHVLEGRGWKRVIIRRDAVPFDLGAGLAWALIDPHANFQLGLRDEIRSSNRWYSRAPAIHLERLRVMLGSMGVEIGDWFGLERSFRFREGVLEPGEPAAVQGLVAADRPTDLALVMALRGTPEDLLLIADRAV
jgi:hypothetical protein